MSSCASPTSSGCSAGADAVALVLAILTGAVSTPCAIDASGLADAEWPMAQQATD
jgi:hypothetical protein